MRLARPFLLVLFRLVPLWGQPDRAAADSFFFIQMADPQFGMYTKDKDFQQETVNYEFAIGTANRLKPRFVIICGDLVNKPGDEGQITEYFRISKSLDASIRLYPVAGNHDVENAPTPESLEAYRKRFGPDYYGFREGLLYGIVLNSSLIHSPAKSMGEMEKQEEWLRAELEKAKGSGARHIVVFLHHPLFLERGDEADQYFNIPQERRKRLLELLGGYRVKLVMAGHYHRNAHGREGEVEMVTTGPVGQPLGGGKSGIRLVWVDETGIHHQYFEFGALPNKAGPVRKPDTGRSIR